MASVTNRQIVDTIIANNGIYPGDPPVVKVVEYNNAYDGGVTWGLVYGHDPIDRYERAANCHNVRTIFERK